MKREEKSGATGLGELRLGFAVAALVSLFLNLLVLTSPLYMIQVFDRVLTSGSTETLLFLTLMAGAAVLTLGLLDVVRSRLLSRIATWLDQTLGARLIVASVQGGLHGSGDAEPLRDLANVRSFVGGQGIVPLFDAPWVPVFVAVIWLLHPLLGMLAAAAAVLLFALAVANELATRRLLRDASGRQIGLQRQAETAVDNADVVQAMGMLPDFARRWAERNDDILALQAKAANRSGLITGGSKFMRVLVQILTLGLGALLVLRSELTPGGMIAASILLGRALAPVEQAIGAWRSLVSARTSYGRLKVALAETSTPRAAMPLPAPAGHLEVERVTYMPPRVQRPVLRSLSFRLEPGAVLGIVGPSAAGKSTLCRLLVGSWAPTQGHVRLDGADVATWEAADRGQYVGYLPQDVELFPGTVRDNIARLGGAEPDEVVAAARLAGVHDMILRLPDGYETELGPRGSVLSGGQRQRIGLARALFRRPRLIVLDEPNSNLDEVGEAMLLTAIGQMRLAGSTIVLVAHRRALLNQVDTLLFLEDGVAQLYGPRDAVIRELEALRRGTGRGEERPRPAVASLAAAQNAG